MNRFLTKLFLLNLSNLIDRHYWVLFWSPITWRYRFWSSALNILGLLDKPRWFAVNGWGLKIFGVNLRLELFVRNYWVLDGFGKILFKLVCGIYFASFLFCKWWTIRLGHCITDQVMNVIGLGIFKQIQPLLVFGNKGSLHLVIEKVWLILPRNLLIEIVIWIVFWVNMLRFGDKSWGKVG